MLKRFFISLLGTMAGIWMSILLVIFCGFMLIGIAVGDSMSESGYDLKKKSVLYLDLSGNIAERRQSQDFMQFLRNYDDQGLTLEDIKEAIYLAADEDNIEGIYIKCDNSGMSMASRQEIVEALSDFRITGKWVIAYADNYSQGDYLIASTASEVYLNPVGAIDIHGVGGTTPFFKNLLDKLGVKMQIVKVGTFKSAVEPFILTSMSEPARLQMLQYCDTLWTYAAQTIADNRDIRVDTIRAMASQMIATQPAKFFLANGLVDELRYNRQVEDRLRELTDVKEDKEPRLVTPDELISAIAPNPSTEKDHIAVYYACGDISDSGKEGIVGPDVTGDIVELANDKHVRGLILRVNSGGGSAFASEQIWEALEYFKSKGKPFYVSMGDVAASGGYYISCGADSIVADRTTITGSIGVFGMIPDMSGLISGKLGIDFSTVETNPNAAGISTVEPMTPSQYAAMQRSVEDIYDLFTRRVAEGRHMSQDAVKEIAEGRVWVGSRAEQLGLVDKLGSLETTIDMMCDATGLDADRVISYPLTKEQAWEKLLRKAGGLDALDMSTEFDGETLGQLRFIQRLRTMNPIQARMEIVRFN